jgi:ubiquinone/menaquinone biosynthesis C-methylase UbiE
MEKSYSLHEKHFDQYGKGGAKNDIAESWFREGSVAWAQARQRDAISDSLLKAYPGAEWLTVGDGRYGSDAHYLMAKGARALATDISDTLLKEGADMGYIKEFRKENAENLSFKDDSFDFVLCKESYHHFPRPMKALYEMLRVGRKGVILLEPVDPYVYKNVFQALFRGLLALLNATGIFKLLLGREVKKHTYEEVGNYVYKISEREIEKTALGLNYPCIAFKGLNIYHIANPQHVSVKGWSIARMQERFMTGLLNLLSALRLTNPELLSAIIFKEMPTDACLQALRADGYRVVLLPRNPYW